MFNQLRLTQTQLRVLAFIVGNVYILYLTLTLTLT